MIAWWSWQLAGVWAAIFATTLFAFDPNFLAHGPLVKNDVLITLLMTTMLIAVWRFGRRGTLPALAGMTVACAAAVNVKFSGLLLGPLRTAESTTVWIIVD
jgi:4-amino-4-deoxy-L-arabinose transferase-like glycosyltransferase